MSPRVIALLIWVGSSLFMAVLLVPVVVTVFARDWASWSLITWIDVLIPNLLLIFVPSSVAAAAYLFITSRMRRN